MLRVSGNTLAAGIGASLFLLAVVGLAGASTSAFAGANGRIVFASNRDGDYDIYTMKRDGSDVLQLTSNRVADREPTWSADGNRIAYVSGGEVWVMEADGTLEAAWTAGAEAQDLSWAPDSKRIVFLDYEADVGGERDHPGLYVIDARHNRIQHITPLARSDFYYHATRMSSPAWSPARGVIAVAIEYADCPSFLNPAYGRCVAVVLLNEDGSGPRAITVQEREIGSIDWSPDGSLLAVELPGFGNDGRAKSDLSILTMDGRFTEVTRNPDELSDSSVSWSPDGSSLLFDTAMPKSDYERDRGAPREVATIRPDGSGRRLVAASPSDDAEPDQQSVGSRTLPASQAVTRIGRGIGSWRVGARRRIGRNFLRSERHRRNDGTGCVGGPGLASVIDYYAGFRVSYVRGRRGRFFLIEVASDRVGDRTAEGFTIGRSRFKEIRARYPRATVGSDDSRYHLGRRWLMVYRSTGYESGKSLTYWFDAQGMLVALDTGISGC